MKLIRGDLGIKPEWREVYSWASKFNSESREGCLADLSLHLCAKLLESEFRLSYHLDEGYGLETDPRHDYDWPAWIEAARKFLSERRDDEH